MEQSDNSLECCNYCGVVLFKLLYHYEKAESGIENRIQKKTKKTENDSGYFAVVYMLPYTKKSAIMSVRKNKSIERS